MEVIEKTQKVFMGMTLAQLQEQYLAIKRVIGSLLLKRFHHHDMFESDKELFSSLKKLAGDQGIIEIGMAYGNGDKGHGYYKVFLILNLKHIEAQDLEHMIYLASQYVPATDQGYNWENQEFHELETLDFVKILPLLSYMQVLACEKTLQVELYRLSYRKSATCLFPVEAGGISFC